MKESPDELGQRIETLEKPRLKPVGSRPARQCQPRPRDRPAGDSRKSARALTGARYGLIAVVDDDGLQDLVTAGLTPDEDPEMAAWPDGPRLFAHFRDLRGR